MQRDCCEEIIESFERHKRIAAPNCEYLKSVKINNSKMMRHKTINHLKTVKKSQILNSNVVTSEQVTSHVCGMKINKIGFLPSHLYSKHNIIVNSNMDLSSEINSESSVKFCYFKLKFCFRFQTTAIHFKWTKVLLRTKR